MCTHILRGLFCCALFFFLAQCGEVIQSFPDARPDKYAGGLDGAQMNYAFARTELSVSATYKAGAALTIAAPTTAGMPDFGHVHTLVYKHNPLSFDAPDVMLDGVLLKQVSSTTTDQTSAAMTAVNSLLTQAIATQTALNGAATKPPAKADLVAPTVTGTCDSDLQVSRVRDLTNEVSRPIVIQQASPKCGLDLTIAAQPTRIFGLYGYTRDDDRGPTEELCNNAVCFRLTAGYDVTITANVIDKSTAKIVATSQVTTQVLGASRYHVGYVHFNRRPFTANMTQLSFTSGLVSEFKASDPSEVVGFLAVPTAALATAAILK
jgi:hypothetical protein